MVAGRKRTNAASTLGYAGMGLERDSTTDQ